MENKDKTWRGHYPTNAEIQYRDGIVKIKTKEFGLIPKSRMVAQLSNKVINGGHDLMPGQRVFHLDMNSHGQPGHDRPENLVVVQHRTTKYEFLKRSHVLHWGDAKPGKEISLLKTARRPGPADR